MSLQAALTATAAFTPAQFETFAKHFDADWIDEALEATGFATLRRRRLPAEQVVWLVIGMALMRNRPIVDVVRHLELALPGAGKTRSVAPSAVAQARTRLGKAPLEWLFLRSADAWGLASAEQDLWRGLVLLGVDGTTLRVPDSEENRAHFGAQSAGERGTSGYPIVRMAALMALRSHLLVAASFGAYTNNERVYAADLWASVPDNSLTLVDRGFLQADILVPLMRGGRNRHWMTRAKKNSKWRVIETLGRGDWLIEIEVSREARSKDPTLPKTYQARATSYQRKGFQPQTLLTSLTDAKQYPAAELSALYHERWELELGFDELKTEMLEREETIRSKCPDAVTQELFGILIAYNLVRLEMERIADEIGVKPTRISFVAALRYIVDEWGWATITASPGAIPRHLADLRDTIRRFLLPPRRPDRSSPRAVKIKMSNYARKRPSPSRKTAK